ncbi:hypothetical protein [Winogradskyella sp.]|uniref:hypothetical protein n=1 Tax=Winogradskyella sp. TaxID=1883156 RepID=UPI00261B5039|nr:hypothetical protein [Winogradskyella sp.]
MNEKKNIDRLFQEKFKDFEVAPNDAVWNRINESLPNNKKKRRVVPIWWQIGGVAAAIALLFTIGVSVLDFGNTATENPTIVDTEQNDPVNKNTVEDSSIDENKSQKDLNQHDDLRDFEIVDSDDMKESTIDKSSQNHPLKKENSPKELTTHNPSKTNTVVNNNKGKPVSKKSKSLTTKTSDKLLTIASTEDDQKSKDKSKLDDIEKKSTIKKAIIDNKTAVAENSSPKSSDSESATNDLEKETLLKEETDKASILDAIANNTKDIDEKEEDEQSRWSITPNVAPVYFSSLGQGSTIHNQFNNNTKSSDINMSYGITGSYAITKKLSVRAGVNRVDLNYATADVIAFNGADTASRSADAQGNISFKNNQFVSLVSLDILNRSSTPEALNTKVTGDIDQRFGFIEVPLELEYRLLDKKFGVNVIGGFSTFFLNQNEIYADIDGSSTLIGEANNINSTSFSANFGLGLDYDLSKRWNINLEPQFKYQINTFNNTFGDFRPFFIGVYTGLKFKF